jgi:uncharacterized protein (TIGR03435 family)
MSKRPVAKRPALIGAAAYFALAIAGGSFARAQSSGPEDWQGAAGGKMAFDVVSVKLNNDTSGDPHSNVDLGPMDSFSPTGGLLETSNEPLIRYITFAYKLSPEEAKFDVQPQLPKWANTRDYDITARASSNPTKDQLRLMMQFLLGDRFKLAVHYEAKKMPVQALVLDKSGQLGPNLRAHKDEGVPCTTVAASEGTPMTASGFPVQCGSVVHLPISTSGVARMGARALDSSALTDVLGVWDQTDQRVVDETGLGLVDFVIEFTPDRMTNTGREYNQDAPLFVEALRKQLGLKFVSRKASVRLIVIDHIEEPAPN